MSYFDRLILQCRAGFEKEAAAEITDRAAELGCYGYCQLKGGDGYVQFICPEAGMAERLVERLPFQRLIFVRQWLAAKPLLQLEASDRVGQLKCHLEDFPGCESLWVEHPDTTEGRELRTFCRKFGSALAQDLRKHKMFRSGEGNRLQLFVLSGSAMFVGYAPTANSAPWEMGIPRLKFPRSAPSRSTLKLEEAWHWFLPAEEWDARLPMGGTAVDLGAAPGGWTWQLVQRSMFVTAVDNGPMDDGLMQSGQVAHKREDGYLYVPERPADWMVCDIVDKPARTAAMAAEWLWRGWCREAVFNLKLPMKQRYQETANCLSQIAAQLAEHGIRFELRAKQLYHDREEVTCHLRRL